MEFAPGVVLIGLKPNVSLLAASTNARLTQGMAYTTNSPALQADLAALGVSAVQPVFVFAQNNAGLRVQTQATANLASIYRLRLSPNADVKSIVAVLAANPSVAFAEPDYGASSAHAQRSPV